MLLLFLIVASLGAASWQLICLIISLILLFIAAFINPQPGPEPRWYARVSWGWAGLFFFVLATALG